MYNSSIEKEDEKLGKNLKNRKGLSPVVAAIILMAVTVAVSIAVAAWMGALTFTFMGKEEIKITKAEFLGKNIIRLTVDNTGTLDVTVYEVWINNERQYITMPILPLTIDAASSSLLNVTYTWAHEYNYQFKLQYSASKYLTYDAPAPTGQ